MLLAPARSRHPRFLLFSALSLLATAASPAVAQLTPKPTSPASSSSPAVSSLLSRSVPTPSMQRAGMQDAQQVAEILNIRAGVETLQTLRSAHPCNENLTPVEESLRRTVLEAITVASLDVDGVLSEISAERSDLQDLRTALQARRDKTVGYLNAAALITGAGIGIAVNAAQLKDSTAIPGDYVGIGSGAASVALSILAIKKQHGPRETVGTIPNMLAPLFDKEAKLESYYPRMVLQYLDNIPPQEDPSRGSRLAQLKAKWATDGRIGTDASPKTQAKIAALTSSADANSKLSIDDLSDRIAMVDDVAARVAFMKRDLAVLMHSYRAEAVSCAPPAASSSLP